MNGGVMNGQVFDTRDEDLKVGDLVEVLGRRRRIVAIRPYRGPHVDIVFAVVDTDLGCGFSLERGGYTRVIR